MCDERTRLLLSLIFSNDKKNKEKLEHDPVIKKIVGDHITQYIIVRSTKGGGGIAHFKTTLGKFPKCYVNYDHIKLTVSKLTSSKTIGSRDFYEKMFYFFSTYFETIIANLDMDRMKSLAYSIAKILNNGKLINIREKKKALDSVEKFKDCCDQNIWFSAINNAKKLYKFDILNRQILFKYLMRLPDLGVNPNLISTNESSSSKLLDAALSDYYNCDAWTKNLMIKGAFWSSENSHLKHVQIFFEKRKLLNLKNLVIDVVFEHGLYTDKLSHYFYKYKGLDKLYDQIIGGKKDNKRKTYSRVMFNMIAYS